MAMRLNNDTVPPFVGIGGDVQLVMSLDPQSIGKRAQS